MNSQASDDIKLLFIEEELSQFGEELCDALSDALTKQKLIESGSLLDSLNYSSFKEGKNPGQRMSFIRMAVVLIWPATRGIRYRLTLIVRFGVFARTPIKRIDGMLAICMVG